MAKGKYKRKRMIRERKQMLIADSGISTRVVHLLENAGIRTMYELDLYPIGKFEEISGIGEASMKEIMEHRKIHSCVADVEIEG